MSSDGGKTWSLTAIIPAKKVGSQSYCFSDNGKSFYGSISIDASGGPNKDVVVFHTDDPTNNQPLRSVSVLSSGSELADQPFIQARSFPLEGKTTNNGSEAEQRVDRIYVGQNYFGPELGVGKTASVRVSVDGKPFKLLGLEARSTGKAGQDGPSVRPAIANDDTVYVAFFHWTSKSGANYLGDVIVVRDDDGARGENSFRSLIEPTDELPGRIVVSNRVFPFGQYLGKQMIGSPLSLAVDPNRSSIIYLAWVDFDQPLKSSVIHLKRSTDRGQTWSADLLTIPSATNPALAVSDKGEVGLLFQQLKGHKSEQRWETHFQKSPDGVGAWSDITLTRFPTSGEPPLQYDPYLGYRIHLLTVENNFYGVFSAPNNPEQKYFPAGVIFQRKYQNKELVSKDGRRIGFSIDPYFFRIPTRSGPYATHRDVEEPVKSVSKTEWRLLAWIKPNWPALLLLAVIGAIVLFLVDHYRTPQIIDRKVNERIKPPPALTNYEGFVTARFADAAGNNIGELREGLHCNLIVEFSVDPPNQEWVKKISLQGGEDSKEAIFTITIDTDDFEVTPYHKTLSVPTTEGSRDTTFSLVVTNKVEEYSLFVQVFQRTQLVQVLAPKLLVVSQV